MSESPEEGRTVRVEVSERVEEIRKNANSMEASSLNSEGWGSELEILLSNRPKEY